MRSIRTDLPQSGRSVRKTIADIPKIFILRIMVRYTNSLSVCSRRSFWHFILWKAGYYDDSLGTSSPPEDFSYPMNTQSFDPESPSVVWIGHSSFLIEVHGVSFLTDPVWDTHCSPVRFQGLKRRHLPPIPLSDLPPIDYVLISHNHYDHLDVKTVKHLHLFHPTIQWIVPIGLRRWFQRRGIMQVHEIGWWNSHQIEKGAITSVPAQHFSGRTLWDRNKSCWNGYVCEIKNKRFYFCGDTGYNATDFKKIGNRWRYMDLSLLPIGTYVPRKFMEPVHCSPWDAVEIHCDVKSHLSLGMHWKTFCLSDEPMDLPPYDLYLAMSQKNLNHETFLPIDPGIYVNW